MAESGILKMAILPPPDPVPAEEYAAEELRRHLCMMLGAPFSLRNRHGAIGPAIHINNRPAAAEAGIDIDTLALAPEAFHIETRNDSLYILGGTPRGALYGVYHLLETLGCRWFTPEVSHIPRCSDIRLPGVCLTQAPAFEFRDTFNWEVGDPVWWVRNRLNGWYTPVPDYMGGHTNYCGFVHTFNSLLPPDEFFASHPEYFSMIKGARRREDSQLCLTNPDVIRIVTQRVMELMKKNPRVTIFSVSQNDWNGYCECPPCKALAEKEGSQSGPIIHFVNAIARETSRRYPEKLIDTLAYWYSADAPRHVVPHANVRVRLCPIRCCQGHEFGTCDHPESQRAFRALKEWRRRTKQLYIWHYCTNFANYPFPMPDFDELHANIALYKRFGVYGIFMQGMGSNGGGAESMALRGYVIGRLLWNPSQPVWPIIDEFLKAYYGKAAPQVRRYLNLFHDRVRKNRHLHPSLYDLPTHPLFQEKTLREADRVLAQGEALTRGAERLRVQLLRTGPAYVRLSRICGRFRRVGNIYRGDGTNADLKKFNAIVAVWKRAGVEQVKEGEPLAAAVRKIHNRLTPYRIEWLRDAGQSIAIVPNIGGRLIEWNAHGRQWLAPADPDNQWLTYPMSEGYAEFAIPDIHSFHGWWESFRVSRIRGGITLSALVATGIQLQRTLAFRAGVLHIDSQLRNQTPAPVHFAWGCGLHLTTPASATTRFVTAGGTQRFNWADISDGLDKSMPMEGDRRPLGEWQVLLPGFTVSHRFDDAVARTILGKVAAKNILALDLRSASRTMAPGESIRVRQQISIRRTDPNPEVPDGA